MCACIFSRSSAIIRRDDFESSCVSEYELTP